MCAGRPRAGGRSTPTPATRAAIAEGIFEFWWRGETLYARNNAVGDSYLFAWSNWLEEAATEGPPGLREQALIWRANYHPDGGQLFYPVRGAQFVVPLAPPGDDVKPEDFVAFRCDGTRGLYIHPNIWHGAVVPLADTAELLDRHAAPVPICHRKRCAQTGLGSRSEAGAGHRWGGALEKAVSGKLFDMPP